MRSIVCNQSADYMHKVMTYTLKRDYIRLTAITYQSCGLDKIKHLQKQVFYFWCRWWDSNPHDVAINGF